MGLLDLLFSNREDKKDKSNSPEFGYEPYNFEEEELEDDDYYYEDDNEE